MSPVRAVMVVGGVVLIFSIFAAGIMVVKKVNIGTQTAKSACMLEQIGAKPGLGSKPWDVESPQWVMSAILCGILILRKWVFTFISARVYKDAPADKQAKVATYMLEVVATSAALCIMSYVGYWGLLFNPEKYQNNADELYSLAWGFQVPTTIMIATYVLELGFDLHMRRELVVHHMLAIVLNMWGNWAIALVNIDVMMLRVMFALSLYMTTEGSVFVTMLLYQRKVYIHAIFQVSAWFYALTRVFIVVMVWWTWLEMYDTVFSIHAHNSMVVYSFWAFMPMSNFILNATQILTVVSLFGIASRVKRRSKETPQTKKIDKAFDKMDLDGVGTVDFDAFKGFVQTVCSDLVFPQSAYKYVFDAIDIDKAGVITRQQFRAHMEPLMENEMVDAAMALKASILYELLDKGDNTDLEKEAFRERIGALLRDGEGEVEEKGHVFLGIARTLSKSLEGVEGSTVV